jgi:hypothetical protein
MSTMREHLADMHKRHQQHHELKATVHKTMATHFKKLAGHFTKTEVTEAEKDAHGTLEALSNEHDTLWQEHSDLAEYHEQQMEACSKAMDSDLNKLIPTQVSGVTPERPRAIPRHGQPAVPAAPNVPLEFMKLVTVDEQE